MKSIKNLMVAAMAAATLAGCASAATRDALNMAKTDCAAGDSMACAQQPQLQAQANAEANDNAGKVALAAILLPILVLGAMANAQQQPDYVIVPVCHRYSC